MSSPSDPPSSEFRSELRRSLIAAREGLPPQQHALASAAIEARLRALLTPRAPRVVAFCWPFRGEFDARPLVSRLIGDGVRAALPVVVDSDAPLVFREWTPRSEMIDDRFGIHIPLHGDALRPELILIPLIGFDALGFRLGYGGGYFDRTLAALVPRPLTIGVGFELARVDTIRPQAHDLPLDYVVTERATCRRTTAGLEDLD